MFKCAHCQNRHHTVAEARTCAFPQIKAVNMSTVPMVTSNQLNYIGLLGGDVELAKHYTKKYASLYIDKLQSGVGTVAASSNLRETAPNRVVTKVPLAMLESLPDGYYASRQDSTQAFTFFRVSRPKSGKFAGCLKIQTQHGPEYELFLVRWAGGNVTVYDKRVEDDMLLVVVDPNGTSMAYAKEIGRCMRCNTELTDARSRWYGIGPECEKHRPHIIGLVNDTKGVFTFGA